MEYKFYIILFAVNTLLYSFSFVIIFFNDNYSAISIRSPKLIIISNISTLLMSSSYLSYEMINNLNEISSFKFIMCTIFPLINFICHFVAFFCVFMRLFRILNTCNMTSIISGKSKYKAKNYYSSNHLMDEHFYIKLLFMLIGITSVLFIIIYLSVKGSISYPNHFHKCYKYNNNSFIFMGYNFVFFFESLIYITMIYKFYISNLKKRFKNEFISQLITNYLFFYCSKFFQNEENKFQTNTIIFFIFCYINLIFNSFYPYVLSKMDRVKVSYNFNPKAGSDLYLFLSDEICYYSFSNFMKKKVRGEYYITIYTQIMKYKYKYTLEYDYYKVLKEAKALYEKYFSTKSETTYLDERLLNIVRSTCKASLNKEECTYEMFDDALVHVYSILDAKFKEYRKGEEYDNLINNLNLNSYLQYKMCAIIQ